MTSEAGGGEHLSHDRTAHLAYVATAHRFNSYRRSLRYLQRHSIRHHGTPLAGWVARIRCERRQSFHWRFAASLRVGSTTDPPKRVTHQGSGFGWAIEKMLGQRLIQSLSLLNPPAPLIRLGLIGPRGGADLEGIDREGSRDCP